ncbi:MAG: flippase-like domain-containing protein [Chloroflexota bacterium]|nr:MAG: flippase-like domain-containing protein [Chloroflexota bacterium]
MSALSQVNGAGIKRWLPGLVISAIAIFLLIRFSSWSEVVQAVSLMNLGLLVPALVFFLISLGFRALAWRVLLQNKVDYGRTFLTLNEGYLLNNIFPLRLGEIGRAFFMSQSTDLSGFFVLSTIVIERAYDLAIAAGLLLSTLPYVFGVEMGETIALSVMIIVILGLFTMFLLARNRQWIQSKLEDFSLRRFAFRDRILPRIKSLLAGLGVLAKFDQFLLSVLFMLISWLFGGLELYFITISFGIQAEFWWIGFILGVISLGIAIPSAPAGLGVFEVAMVGAFSFLGISSSVALAIALVFHFIHIALTGFFGLYGIFRDGESITGLFQQLRNFRYSGETS